MEPESPSPRAEAEASFARFRARGEPEDLARVFDLTVDELRPVARRLARGASAADDLIQETFLAAIEGRESYDPARPLMPWLVGILVRQASAARRRARREPDPARLAVRESAGAEGQADAREFQALVAEALASLPARDRDVLVPLLFDGKRAVQIARELGRKPDTVRMRIHRGLERLRRLLPSSVALPAWVPYLGRLASVRETVLRAARQAARPAGPLIGPEAAPQGGLAAGSAAASGAAGLGVAGSLGLAGLLAGLGIAVGWIAFRGQDTGDRELATAAGQVSPGATTREQAPNSRTAAAGLAERGAARSSTENVAVEPPRGVPTGQQLTGSLEGLSPEEAAAARLVVRGLAPEQLALALEAAPDGLGRFSIDVAALRGAGARRLSLLVEHPLHLPVEARIDVTDTATLDAGVIVLRRATGVTGTVVDRFGTPQSGAAVGLFSLAPGNQDVLPIESTLTGPEGSFRLRTARPGPHAVVACRPGSAPAGRLCDVGAEFEAAGMLRLEPGLTISGRVVQGDGPGAGPDAAGAIVRLEAQATPGERRLRLGEQRLLRRGERFEIATALAAGDAEGRFEFNGLAGQPYDLGVERAGAFGDPPGTGTVLPGDSALTHPRHMARGVRAPTFDLRLASPWARLEFQWTEGGVPASRREGIAADVFIPGRGAVRLVPDAHGRGRLQAVPGSALGFALVGCSVHGETQGQWTVPGSGPGSGPGKAATLPVTLIALEVAAPAPGASLELSWNGAAPPAGESLGVGFFPATRGGEADRPAEPLFTRRTQLDAAGRARLENLPAGNWRVVVRGGGSFERSFGSLVPAEFDLSIAPGEVLRQSLPTVEGARVRLWVRSSTGAHQTARARLFDAAGREHPLSLCALEPETQTEVSGRVVLERWNEFGPLAAGDWRLALDSLWHEPLELQFRVQPGELRELSAEFRAR
jgi:RNA polymerase sigma factor (sigma-70 family)